MDLPSLLLVFFVLTSIPFMNFYASLIPKDQEKLSAKQGDKLLFLHVLVVVVFLIEIIVLAEIGGFKGDRTYLAMLPFLNGALFYGIKMSKIKVSDPILKRFFE